MAALNTVRNIESLLTLDGSWKINTSTASSTKGLFIMIKQTLDTASANINTDGIRVVKMEIGLDSGETDQILIIDSYTFNFSPIALVSANSINDRAAYCKVSGELPQKFYYRISAIETENKVYYPGDLIEGKAPVANIKLNVEELTI